MQSKLYIWKKDKAAAMAKMMREAGEKKNEVVGKYGEKLSGERLRDLAWSLNVLDLSKNKNNTQ